MRILVKIILFSCILYCYINATKAQWSPIEVPIYVDLTGECGHGTKGEVASNDTIYWVFNITCGYTWVNRKIKIHKSTDCGSTWSQCYSVSDEFIKLQNISFISGDAGFLMTSYDPFFIQNHVYRTENGMGSLNSIASSLWPLSFTGINMINYNEIIAINRSSTEYTFIRLENGIFNIVSELPIPKAYQKSTIESTPNQTIFITCETSPWVDWINNIILRSTNGGLIWTTSFEDTTFSVNDMRFSSDNKGIAVCKYGKIIKTEDAGETWQSIPSPTGVHLNSIDYLDELTWVVVGNSGTILYSDDGGGHWVLMDSPTANQLIKVKFPEKDELVFIQTSSNIWKADINLLTKVPSKVDPENYFQVYPNPAKESFTIVLPSELIKNSTLTMHDIYGKNIFQMKDIKQSEVIDCGNFTRGVYSISISNQQATHSQKIIVQ